MSRQAATLRKRDSATDDDPRWQAVLTRDGSLDGKVYFAVQTTGVYCRPSCGARTPKRANVSFFSSADAAEAAGFRPCKRCRPNGAGKAETEAALVAAACRSIEAAETPPALRELAAAAGLSPHHFHRLFKAVTGVTPKGYTEAQRRARVQASLRSTGSVTAAILDAGYNSPARFYEAAGSALGMSPKAYRSGGSGIVLTYGVAPCALGQVLVAATGTGIAAILLGDDRETLERDLANRFPKAELIRGDRAFGTTLARVVQVVEDPSAGLKLPLDIQGTAFQQRVWAALRQIPPGATVTYADVARAIEQPEAVRAVACACAANPIAVVIPCHRVVRADGGLSGYRWGVTRKRKLIERERRRAQLSRET